ncbi:hypothetical protein CW731_13005 [Polaribacter sp. ALD11]|uniref:hypothetical protein n=1 Tax=Polaribacter sp. ALD11 TaxID=2058137 RepID=UPI000C30B085|nr:hypothetical protein [Polaribacter sp. ALD11]AUC86143.1 hypothetical protein CW731_13005 [Polaribacter sp. ALD11]
MKKLATILVFVLAFTLSTQAQKKRGHKRPQLTTEQQTDLTVKRMTLALDLSERQQNQMKPIITSKVVEKKALMEKRKEARKNDKRPSSDEIYAMKSKMLDNRIAMKNSMKDILNKEQFEKFEKMHKKRAAKDKQMMKKKSKNNSKRNKKRADK